MVYEVGYYHHPVIIPEEEVKTQRDKTGSLRFTVITGFKAIGFLFGFFSLLFQTLLSLPVKFLKYTVMTDLLLPTKGTLSQPLASWLSPLQCNQLCQGHGTVSGSQPTSQPEGRLHASARLCTPLQFHLGLCAHQYSVLVTNLFMPLVLTIIMLFS